MRAVIREKAEFVDKYLKPLLVATGDRTGINDVEFVYDAEDESETVIVTVHNEKFRVNVNCDSLIAIVHDVMRVVWQEVV